MRDYEELNKVVDELEKIIITLKIENQLLKNEIKIIKERMA